MIETEGFLQIYYNAGLVCTHALSDQPLNYKSEHYVEGLKSSIEKKAEEAESDYEEKIRKKAETSLKRMKDLKGKAK